MDGRTINKRFPANTSLNMDTFLNDKKVDGELYAFLQTISYVDTTTRITYVLKKKMPTQAIICSKIKVKTPKTYKAHLAYLIKKGYVIEEVDRYILPEVENQYIKIPLPTLQFLNDQIKEQTYKIYVYLGQRWKMKLAEGKGEKYSFTEQEIAEHLGIKLEGNPRGWKTIREALQLLLTLSLIEYVQYFEGQRPRMRLMNFSLDYQLAKPKIVNE